MLSRDVAAMRAFYREASGQYWHETVGNSPTVAALGRHDRTELVLRAIQAGLARPGVVVDLGCGPGQLGPAIERMGHRYVGLDLVPEMFVRAAAASIPLAFVAGAVEGIPLADECADAAVCSGVIEYVADPPKVLAEIHRLLRPGGTAIVTFPNSLNPIHAVRAMARPIAAPVLRACLPNLRRTVFVSSITHHVFVPSRVVRIAEAVGFETVTLVHHGFLVSPWNHRLSARLERFYARLEQLGRRWVPSLGSNCLLWLRKP